MVFREGLSAAGDKNSRAVGIMDWIGFLELEDGAEMKLTQWILVLLYRSYSSPHFQRVR